MSASGTAPGASRQAHGAPGELVVGARVVLVYYEPELDLHEGQPETLTRVDVADREVGFLLDDGREFTADASVITPAQTDADGTGGSRGAGSVEGPAEDAPALW